MAWVTGIKAMEQVEYRLSGACGCDLEHAPDAQVAYRLGPDMEWVGAGLAEVGLTAGTAVHPDAARALMQGTHPGTGEQLVTLRRKTDPRSHLAAAPLIEAIHAARHGDEQDAAQHDGPVLRTREAAALFGRMERRAVKEGERCRYAVQDLAEVADAAGVALEDVYGADELAAARQYEGWTVPNGNRGYDLVLDLPKSYSALMALADPATAAELEEMFLEAARETVAAVEGWCAYTLAGHNGDGRTPSGSSPPGCWGG